MSPRAAWRLEALGFSDVYDYVPGKIDWLSHGLPTEGAIAANPTAGDVARRDVPRCGLHDRLADVRPRVREAGWDTCIVVNEHDVVLGRLGRKALSSEGDGHVEDVMAEGPSTIRPRVALHEITKRLRALGLTTALVTTSDGRLVGVLRLEDAVRRLTEDERRAA
jgi:Mg/Co/Ni transporter MgtE